MRTGNNPNEFNTSLVQQQEQRNAIVEKMRGKLAGPSQSLVQTGERRRYAARKTVFGWGWRIALAIVFALGNLAYVTSRQDAPVKAAVKTAPRLPGPAAKLSVNDQALYWTYALYDFDQLKSRFGVSSKGIVDAGLAKRRLRELLPKADARTRFLIERMTPPERRRP
jgi:hypothetical protein